MARRESYTAAGVFPAKIVRKAGEFMNGELIYPHHPQISLTNRCNLSCEFCSCGEREKQLEMPLQQAKTILMKLRTLGSKALTITGGGEPLLYYDFDKLVAFAVDELGMQVGLVTNGLQLPYVRPEVLAKLTWCRVSFDGSRDVTQLEKIRYAAWNVGIDWAFSYVLTRGDLGENLGAVVEIANDLNFTHVRVVDDILDPSDSMDDMCEWLGMKGIDDSKVIYQGRKDYTPGTKRCMISLLKPFIGTDGQVYPCCGIQYAKKGIVKGFPEEMQMGDDIMGIYQRQENFDGSACDRCYYDSYNKVLDLMSTTLDHEDFV